MIKTLAPISQYQFLPGLWDEMKDASDIIRSSPQESVVVEVIISGM